MVLESPVSIKKQVMWQTSHDILLTLPFYTVAQEDNETRVADCVAMHVLTQD